ADSQLAQCRTGVLGSAVYSHGTFDVAGLTPHMGTVLIQDRQLALGRFDVTETVPDIGVSGHERQCFLLPATADEERDPSCGGRVECAEPPFDAGQRPREVVQSAAPGAELETVLVVVLLEPPRADPKDQTPVRDVVHGASHVRELVG